MVLDRVNVDALFREHHPRLLRYLLRLSGNVEVAEDLAQETFVKALERPPRAQSNMKAWLFTVATNLMRDRARRLTRQTHLMLERDPISPRTINPLEYSQEREMRRHLYAALRDLSERERTAILMRQEGFTHREIAEAIGTTTGTVGTLLARALAKLAKRLPLDGDRL